jgi:maleate isomerase
MDGSKTGVGVILPDDGPFDYEWLRLESWLAKSRYHDVTCIVQRSPADGIMAEENLKAIGTVDALGPCARKLRKADAEVLLWACTSGSFVKGYSGARRQLEELSALGGCPATSTSIAMAEAMHSIGADKVDLLSAYSEPVTALLVDFLRDSGIAVGLVSSLGCDVTEESFAIDIEREVRNFAEEYPSPLPILVPDTAINTLDLLGRLEAAAGRVVVTANQASLWHAVYLIRGGGEDIVRAFQCTDSREPA